MELLVESGEGPVGAARGVQLGRPGRAASREIRASTEIRASGEPRLSRSEVSCMPRACAESELSGTNDS